MSGIEYHVDKEGLALLRINRPQARNALDWKAQEAFAAAVQEAARDDSLRVLIITGAGEMAFVSGGDLKELRDHPHPEDGRRLNQIMGTALAQLTALPLPVIGAVNGDAFGGGCEILTACDLRLAASHARFSFRHVSNSLTTGWGGTARLVKLIGLSQATELLLTGRLLDAAEAQRIGFIHRVIDDGENVEAAAMTLAAKLTTLPQDALAANKALLQAAAWLPHDETDLLEAQRFVELWPAPNHLEAMRAFNEKRSPRFNRKGSK